MKAYNDFRYQKLLWSMVVVVALFMYVARIIQHSTNILGGFGFFAVGGTLFSLLGLSFTILRLFRLIKRGSFVYIFTSTILAGIGAYGIYLLITATVKITVMEFFVFIIPAVLSFFMIVDVFIWEVPYIIPLLKKGKL